MPNKIDTDSIVRDKQHEKKDRAKAPNADYVENLEETSTLMPPEKPFETERAQNHQSKKDDSDTNRGNEDFVKSIKKETSDIERLDKTFETKLYLLNLEHEKVAGKLGDGSISKKEKASLENLITEVEQKIELYRSKMQAGASSGLGVSAEQIEGEGSGEEGGGLGSNIIDGLKDQIMRTAPIILAGKKDEEEEEEEEIDKEKEFDQ